MVILINNVVLPITSHLQLKQWLLMIIIATVSWFRLANTKIINSSQFENSIVKYNLLVTAINSNSKFYKKPKNLSII